MRANVPNTILLDLHRIHCRLHGHTERRLRARIRRFVAEPMIKVLPSARSSESGYLCMTAGAGNIRICRFWRGQLAGPPRGRLAARACCQA
jgi:hypothetical protein